MIRSLPLSLRAPKATIVPLGGSDKSVVPPKRFGNRACFWLPRLLYEDREPFLESSPREPLGYRHEPMTLELLIHSVVRQTAFLIAQLATTGGTRVPLDRIPAEVFLELVRQLERQGVSRRVSADMFGLGLRTYQRKIQRVSEEVPEREQSLWESVLEFIREKNLVRRADVLTQFSREDEFQVRGVLHELCDSGLVFSSSHGAGTLYRAVTDGELGALLEMRSSGLDELLWAFIYQLGPVETDEILRYSGLAQEDLDAVLARLVDSGRIEKLTEGVQGYRAKELVVPLGAVQGWEAAVFDHLSAVVATVSARLSLDPSATQLAQRVGGSTYTFDVWYDHPMSEEVYSTLARVRTMLSEQRVRVEEFNHEHGIPDTHTRVSFYAGQSLLRKGKAENEDQG